MQCVAKFDFESEQSDELSFSEGDVIQLKAYVGQDWARGQLGAFSGIFPLNFVEIIQDLPPAPSQKQQQTPLRKIAPNIYRSTAYMIVFLSKQKKMYYYAVDQNFSISITTLINSFLLLPQSGAEWVVALYDFSGNSEQDLSFEKGDRILITKGTCTGSSGFFPINYYLTLITNMML
uniref:SH3 domain containing 19 n=1 Tax=Neogobius melanostomus TaxID=47308 RepID=A0A8C6V8K5_9GOBI